MMHGEDVFRKIQILKSCMVWEAYLVDDMKALLPTVGDSRLMVNLLYLILRQQEFSPLTCQIIEIGAVESKMV